MNEGERGMTMIEALVVALIVSIVVSVTGLNWLAWSRAEQMRGAVYELYIQMNLARVEAVNRNRPCRFTVDTTSRVVRVLDLNDPADDADDREIARTTLDSGVGFARPDGVAAVTLDLLTGSEYEATFVQDGSLSSGAGAVGLRTDDAFRRVTVYAGGSVAVERWDGSSWVAGS